MNDNTEMTNPPRFAHWREVETYWPSGVNPDHLGHSFFNERHLTVGQDRILSALQDKDDWIANLNQMVDTEIKDAVWARSRAGDAERRERKERRARRIYQVLALLGWAAAVAMGVFL
ncbi:hypothetical protein D3C77_48690 [compost metagenome]